MNKLCLLWRKLSIVTVLSLGFIVLGIGCISWAMFSIGAPLHYSHNGAPTPLTVDQDKFMRDITSQVESASSLALLKQDKPLYNIYPVEGDIIGSLTIPTLKRKLPIIQGTGTEELKKGVGHFTQSVLPGEEDNCVLSGHRDTVFRQIGNLKIGDQLIVETSAGIFTYEVKGTQIVHADDKTVIVPTGYAVLTMTTCYPFYTIGNSPDRYIISAALIKSE